MYMRGMGDATSPAPTDFQLPMPDLTSGINASIANSNLYTSYPTVSATPPAIPTTIAGIPVSTILMGVAALAVLVLLAKRR